MIFMCVVRDFITYFKSCLGSHKTCEARNGNIYKWKVRISCIIKNMTKKSAYLYIGIRRSKHRSFAEALNEWQHMHVMCIASSNIIIIIIDIIMWRTCWMVRVRGRKRAPFPQHQRPAGLQFFASPPARSRASVSSVFCTYPCSFRHAGKVDACTYI